MRGVLHGHALPVIGGMQLAAGPHERFGRGALAAWRRAALVLPWARFPIPSAPPPPSPPRRALVLWVKQCSAGDHACMCLSVAIWLKSGAHLAV